MAVPVTPRKVVRAHLLADPQVAALVGDRIYYQTRPDGAEYPCIVLTTISDVPQRDLQGRAWTETRIQLTVMSQTEPGAETVARAVEQSLDGFAGLMAGALQVIACRVDSSRPEYQEASGHTHYLVDVLISYK